MRQNGSFLAYELGLNESLCYQVASEMRPLLCAQISIAKIKSGKFGTWTK
jgi:hypothetical protein